eukprot:TRINITY_DN1911_c0_g1_i2.p1 TRINITY_DN1911_c0_g1~~TRINITY_DN1911_c0_g1_i2.p1  ORF type:complete len:757 (-),score=235.37 TRINITY_DN1911_c0_g1_i2:308-2578(-)
MQNETTTNKRKEIEEIASPIEPNIASIPEKIRKSDQASSPRSVMMSTRSLNGSTGGITNGKKDQPVKKLVIKGLKVAPKLPENFFDETWNTLQQAVHAVYKSQISQYSLEELYKATENLCSHKMASQLYDRLRSEMETHIKLEVNKLLGQTSDPDKFLSLVDNCWNTHCSDTMMIRAIFLYLDRTYVIQTSNIKSLWDLGLHLFREYVISHPEVQKKTVDSTIILIQRERQGETVARSLLKSVIQMFVSLGIYGEIFERPFLVATQNFYAADGTSSLQELELSMYLRHVESRILAESERLLSYLDSSTRKSLIHLLERNLIENHVPAILAKGFDSLMAENKIEDLTLMFSLFNRVNGLDFLKTAMSNYIKTRGTNLVNDEQKDATLVDELLLFKSQMDNIVNSSFGHQDAFVYAIKESFEAFINSRANRPAELIAKYVDRKLRTGNKGISEEELESLLDKVLVLFRYIHGKDVFEAFYKKDLAKRLLLGKSASSDAEKSMLSKLKAECGASFTMKLEGMFKDIELSKDIMDSANQAEIFADLGTKIDMYVNVLTTGYWPAYAPIELHLPQQMADMEEAFKKFYLSKHSGRRLQWMNTLAQCTVRTSLWNGRELAVSLSQGIALLLFNTNATLSFKEIQEATGMDEHETKKTLMSLSCGKVKVLTKNPATKDVTDSDSFTVTKDIKVKMKKIKINSVQMKETAQEQEKTVTGVMQDRQYQVDAAIVRIMKTRKTLTHTLLINELLHQLKFPAKVFSS